MATSQRRPRSHLSSALSAWLILQFPVAAADITVEGDCSLIDAILASNSDLPSGECPAGSGADRIFLTGDVVLTEKYPGSAFYGYSGLPDIESEIAIYGNGYTIARDATPNFRLLAVDYDGVLEMFETSLVDGYGPWFAGGGAIANYGTLSITDSVFHSNSAGYNADAGALLNAGTLTLTNSTFSYNGGTFCGAIANLGSMRIDGCRFMGNLAASDYFPADNYGQGGAICTGPSHIEGSYFAYNNAGDGGAIDGSGLTIVDSTFRRNNALNGGGAIFAGGEVRIIGSTFEENEVGTVFGTGRKSRFGTRGEGGAIYFNTPSEGDQRALLNTTLSNNSALLSGGALWIAGGSVGLEHVTLVNNSGGSIYVDKGTASMKNSLLVGYPGETSCSGAGTIVNQGGSLADDGSCGPLPDTLVGVSATLTDNGGPTHTHALAADSSARGSGTGCDIALDQRDAPRASPGCDSGAYEFGPCEDLVVRDLTSPMEDIVACDNLWLGPNAVVEELGHWEVTAGSRVVIRDGVTVESDASLTIALDPTLPPP